jgi:hypothetical protein
LRSAIKRARLSSIQLAMARASPSLKKYASERLRRVAAALDSTAIASHVAKAFARPSLSRCAIARRWPDRSQAMACA